MKKGFKRDQSNLTEWTKMRINKNQRSKKKSKNKRTFYNKRQEQWWGSGPGKQTIFTLVILEINWVLNCRIVHTKMGFMVIIKIGYAAEETPYLRHLEEQEIEKKIIEFFNIYDDLRECSKWNE